MNRIYLDHNATTPVDPEVRAEWMAAMERFGNPSSMHETGVVVRTAIEKARQRVARLIQAQPDEIVFTSGGTEANNLAIFGCLGALQARPPVVTTAIEHQSVLAPFRYLAGQGWPVTFLPVDAEGRLRPDAVEGLSREAGEIGLVSAMRANNDTGVLQPVAEVAAAARVRGARVHSDAVQAVGKVPVDVGALGVDLLSFSSHKINGPKGVGVLFVRRGTAIAPLFHGGHQERQIRPGTENAPAIVALGRACELAGRRLEENAKRLECLRDGFEAAVVRRISGVRVNGAGAARMPNTSNLTFEGVDGETLAMNLDLMGVSVSVGSACTAGDREPSPVLLAMGRTAAEARQSLRVSLGAGNTEAELAEAVDRLARAVEMIRKGGRS